ncbi:MAG TPA: preprotein translocase subunit SecY [Methylomirabilota bacterium]|nr:preprotein translocase subunit SecY [Methylomirabilota bacterium]
MLANLFNTFANCFKIPELKSRIIFTLLVLVVCRVIAWVTVPGLDGAALREWFAQNAASGTAGMGLLGLYSSFTGGALQKCAVGALGIMPYITASIIVQLLTAVYPPWAKMAREEGGRVKLIQMSRFLTLLLCLGHGTLMTLGWENPEKIFPGFTGNLVLIDNIWWYRIQTVVLLTAGTLLLMWLGEQITERGIGNGVSLVITVGIVADFPMAMTAVKDMFFPGGGVESQFNLFHAIALILLLGAVIAAVIAVTQAQRKIPVQYAQRAVGRKVYQASSSFMPIRVNYAGVMPIIFAQAILMFPSMIFLKLGELTSPGVASVFNSIGTNLSPGRLWYYVLFGLMILFFSYFWVATQFNELQISDDLKKHGGYIPGVRPGQATSDFLHRTMSRITLAGALFLMAIALIPMLMGDFFNINPYVSQFFGGTSVLITVGVLLDTMRQMETHLLMRHYDGFLKKGRLKGRF